MKTKFYNLSINYKVILATMTLFSGNTLKAQETVTDYDGNVYQTVTIGTQVWMKENLKTTHYRNGDVIPNVSEASAWYGLTSGAYINYNNDSANATIYGRLYNWYAIADNRNICPAGWNVPNDSEWTTLINYLGGESVAGGKMKEIGNVHWKSPNTGANNSSGFTALPGGYSGYQEPLFGDIRDYGFWWSASEHNASNARCYNLGSDYSYIGYWDGANKKYGNSVRCLKEGIVGIKNIKRVSEFEIFPNPTTGILTISFSTTLIQNLNVEIFNLLGTRVFSKTVNYLAGAKIDLSDNPAGLYLVKVICDEETFEAKITKQ